MRRSALSCRIVGTIALASIVAASAVSCGDNESGDEATTMASAETVTTIEGSTSSTIEHATTTSEPSTTVIEDGPAGADGETAAAIPYWPPVLAGITASSPPQPATCPTDGQEPLTDLVPVPTSWNRASAPSRRWPCSIPVATASWWSAARAKLRRCQRTRDRGRATRCLLRHLVTDERRLRGQFRMVKPPGRMRWSTTKTPTSWSRSPTTVSASTTRWPTNGSPTAMLCRAPRSGS